MKNLLTYLGAMLLFFTGTAQEVFIEEFASNFSDPVNLQHAGDDRLFVVEQGGVIKILNPDGTTNATPFLDVSSLVSCCGERGLLGLAFHPDYATNGFFYVNYTDNNGDTQVSRFSVDPADPNVALPGSEFPIIDYVQPFGNHNGGCIAFGPDGYLYISSGDGGSGGDPGNRAQNTELLLGKLLRIDIDNPGGGANYGIPNDNPFAGDPPNRPEIWAYGLRNPWKFSFDRDNGDIWIGDVGQGDVEEIDRAGSTEAGLNYGWRCYEGSDPFNTGGCPDPSTLEFPIAEYSSSTGSGNCSVTGGYVYRGEIYADIQGVYIFADYCSGLLGTVDQSGNLIEQGNYSENWVSFGEDVSGELYAVALGGTIYKIQGGELILGVSDNDVNSLTFYPNPATDLLTVQVHNDAIRTITITDIKGSILYAEETMGAVKKDIPVANLAQGIYLVKVTTETNSTFIKKLVVN